MLKKSGVMRFLAVFVAVVVCVGALTGCASLRKKFTRVKKNKDQKEDFIPVLQPLEYAKVEETPQQIYRGHYTMVRVYFKDLWDILGKPKGGEKSEKFIFTQILARFEGMAALLSDEKKAQAADLREKVLQVFKEYDKPAGLRRYDRMISQMRLIERDLYRAFKPEVVAGSFLAAGR